MPYSTYIILCSNNKYYVGHARDVDKRFTRHLTKDGARFTRQNKPIKILWKQKFNTETEAVQREKQIKGWSREKKDNLIRGIWK